MYKKQKKSWVKHLDFLLLDIVCLEVAFLVSYFIRMQGDLYSEHWMMEEYRRLALVLALLDICLVFFFESYTGILRRNKIQELQATVVHCGTVCLAVVLYMWSTKQGEV